ncbi:MAG TPA: hypothetical protein VMU45_12585 [Candidatus Eisenbacteria bacterium]|nr:hypothetical protein [Candidatus Eisenbacteria bacterium]
MSFWSKRLLYWTPRVLALAFILFLSIFATDVFSENLGFWQTVQDLAIHLIPSFVLLVVLVLAWRWEWIGAAAFAAAALLYVAWLVRRSSVPVGTRVEWAAIIALPALVLAALFLLDWLKHAELHARS